MYFKDKRIINDYILNPIKYTNKNNQLVAYCDIDFSKLINKNIITEIIIGPKSKLNEEDIYNFLLSNNFDVNQINIDKSSATYR